MRAVLLLDVRVVVLLTRTTSILQTNVEGCLSVPETLGEVSRPLGVQVQYLDERGETNFSKMSGLEAACLQHEIDHLDGVLFIDTATKIRARKVPPIAAPRPELEQPEGDANV